jgi:uncharacterized damage-inducible protein DinB
MSLRLGVRFSREEILRKDAKFREDAKKISAASSCSGFEITIHVCRFPSAVCRFTNANYQLMRDTLAQQYNMMTSSRSALLDYCETLSTAHFLQEVNGFGRGGSIRNLLVHVANTYEYWISTHCFAKNTVYTPYESILDVTQCRQLYNTINELVNELLQSFEGNYAKLISSSNTRGVTDASPLKVFTHVTTHEFHHKGQILSISRHLGYTPVDTDVIR